jgi:hypothetical protein
VEVEEETNRVDAVAPGGRLPPAATVERWPMGETEVAAVRVHWCVSHNSRTNAFSLLFFLDISWALRKWAEQ